MNLCLQSGGGWWEVSLRRLRIYLSIEHILTELILGTMRVFTVTIIIIMTVSVCTWQAESITCVSYLGQAVEKRTNRDLHIGRDQKPIHCRARQCAAIVLPNIPGLTVNAVVKVKSVWLPLFSNRNFGAHVAIAALVAIAAHVAEVLSPL